MLVPVTTGTGAFEVLAYNGATGTLIYTLTSDYTLPPHNWVPPYTPALSLGTRLYFAGAGGSVYYRDTVNGATGSNGQPGATGQLVFYGKSIYQANQAALNTAIQISTPLTADRNGNIFFRLCGGARQWRGSEWTGSGQRDCAHQRHRRGLMGERDVAGGQRFPTSRRWRPIAHRP